MELIINWQVLDDVIYILCTPHFTFVLWGYFVDCQWNFNLNKYTNNVELGILSQYKFILKLNVQKPYGSCFFGWSEFYTKYDSYNKIITLFAVARTGVGKIYSEYHFDIFPFIM